MTWRRVKGTSLWRYKMPLGWLVMHEGGVSNTMTYYPYGDWDVEEVEPEVDEEDEE